jgi:ubiquinone/menaquinone biosynthesis C-methylase UbiE
VRSDDEPTVPQYIHGHHASILRTYEQRTADNSAAYLLPELRPGQTLLDVGCGAGSITLDLAERVAPGRVVAVDTSREALDLAEQLARDRGVTTIEFRVGDALALDLPDGSVDVIHAHQVLQHVTDPVAALREMRRVCRPGGVVAARDADYSAMVWWPPEPALDCWRQLYRRVAEDGGGQPDAGRRLLSWARAAGFESVTATASTWCYADPAARQLWSTSWADRIRHSGIAQRALASGAATRQQLDELAEGWLRWGRAEDAWFTIVHGEVLCRT